MRCSAGVVRSPRWCGSSLPAFRAVSLEHPEVLLDPVDASPLDNGDLAQDAHLRKGGDELVSQRPVVDRLPEPPFRRSPRVLSQVLQQTRRGCGSVVASAFLASSKVSPAQSCPFAPIRELGRYSFTTRSTARVPSAKRNCTRYTPLSWPARSTVK